MDTFSIRHDRIYSLSESQFIWQAEAQSSEPTQEVSWSEDSIDISALVGTTVIRNISFQIAKKIQNPNFKIGDYCQDEGLCPAPSELAEFIDVSMPVFSDFEAGSTVYLSLIITIPTHTREDNYTGMFYVLDGEQAIAQPIDINLSVSLGSSYIVPSGPSLANPERISFDHDENRHFTLDQVEVLLRSDAEFEAFSSRLEEAGGVFTGRVPMFPLYQIRFPDVSSASMLDYYLEELNRDEAVVVATREWYAESRQVPPNDREYKDDDWDLENPSGRSAPWVFSKFVSAWEELYDGKDISTIDKINIAVVDSEFSNHPDLDIRLSDVATFVGFSRFLTKFSSHGTSVASVIGAIANNNYGVAGGVWNPNLRLYSFYTGYSIDYLRLGSTAAAQMTALGNALNDGARIVNMSDGMYFRDRLKFDKNKVKWKEWFDNGRHCDPQSYCTRNALFVFSVANDKVDVASDLPAGLASEYGNIISVTSYVNSMSNNFAPSPALDFSQTPLQPIPNMYEPEESSAGGNVSVAAANTLWVATTDAGVRTLELFPTHYFTDKSGTSFSAPMVTALAGLILTKNPDLTAEQIKDVIIGGACNGGNIIRNGLNMPSEPYGPNGPTIPIIDASESLKLVDNLGAAKNACHDNGTDDFIQPAFAEGDPGTVGDGLLISGTSYAIGFLRSATRFNPDPMPFLSDDAGIITLTVYAEAPVLGYESYIFFGLRSDNCNFVQRTINRRVTELGFPEPDGIPGVFGEIDVSGLLAEFSAQGCIGSASDLYIRQVQASAFFGGNMRLDAFAIGSGELKMLEYVP